MAFRTADQAAPARWWRLITPSNSTNLPSGCRALYVNATGDIAAVGEDDQVVTFASVPQGVILPIAVKRVNSTNTTATVVGLW